VVPDPLESLTVTAGLQVVNPVLIRSRKKAQVSVVEDAACLVPETEGTFVPRRSALIETLVEDFFKAAKCETIFHPPGVTPSPEDPCTAD